MADLIWRNALLLAKKESAEGTANAPAGTDALFATGIQPRLQRDFHIRSFQGEMDTRAGVAGAQTAPGLTFQTELKGNGSSNTPEIDELLESVFGTVAAGTGSSTISTGASTTSLPLVSATNFTVGNMVMVETGAATDLYETALITAIATNTLTVEPALSFVPADGANVHEMRTYQLATTAHPALTFDVFYNSDAGASQYDRFVGCHGNVKFDSPRAGQIPLLSWDWSAWNWTQATNGTRPTPTFDTAAPKAALATKFKVAGTLTNVFDVSWDLGNVVTPKLSQNESLGIYGTPITDRRITGAFKLHPAHTSVAQFTGWTAGTEVSLIQQFGNAQYGTWSWYAPQAQRTEVARGDDSGVHTNDVTWAANTGTLSALYLAVG